MESWSGRSSSTTPVERACPRGRVSSIESRVTWWRGGMPSHSSSSSAPSLPQTQAVAHDVVGRRTPTAASSRPVSALNVEDLPEPVAPAMRDDGVVGGQPQPAGRALARRPRPRRPARRRGGRGRPRQRPPAPRSGHRCRCPGSPASWPLRADDVTEFLPRPFWSFAALEAQVVDPTRRLAHLVGCARLEQQPVEEGTVASALLVEQSADPLLEDRRARSARVRTAWSPKTASSSFWPTTAEPPAMPASAPVTPAVWAKTTIISATDRPLTPKARNRAVVRLSAPSVRTISSTSLCQSRTARSARRRRSRDARPRSSPDAGQQRPAGVALPPGRLGPLGRGLGVLEDQRLQPGLDRDGHPLGLLGLALDRVDHAVADPADPGLQRPEQLAGADELLPAGQHLAAQQGAVGRGLGHRRDRAVVRRVGVGAQLLGGAHLLGQRRRRRRTTAG